MYIHNAQCLNAIRERRDNNTAITTDNNNNNNRCCRLYRPPDVLYPIPWAYAPTLTAGSHEPVYI